MTTNLNLAVRVKAAVAVAAITATTLVAATAADAKTYSKVGVNKDRVVELVSTPDATVPVVSGILAASGERALYNVWGGLDISSFGQAGAVFADRTSTGWQSSSALPPRSAFTEADATLYAGSPDLTRLVFGVQREVGAIPQGERTFFQWEPGAASLKRMSTIPLDNSAINSAATSPDARRVIASISLDPGVLPNRLYDMSGVEPVEVGLMPGGASPGCGVQIREHVAVQNVSIRQNWVSADGSRFFFHSRGDEPCSETPNLYMGQGTAPVATTLISGPALSGGDYGAHFSQATRDGRTVFYTTATRLDPADTNGSGDLYRFRVGQGNTCVTCVVSDANVTMPLGWGDYPDTVLVAESGELAYFTSVSALTPDAVGAGDDARGPGAKLYVWREASNSIEFIAPAGLSTTGGPVGATATADGAVLVFLADRPELNALTDSDNGGVTQHYRYDARDRSLRCVSCPEGALPRQPLREIDMPGAFGVQQAFALTSDGRSYFFVTPDPLVEQDVNGAPDIYEWHDGEVGLITDGRSVDTSDLGVRSVSADGRDVLFMSTVAQAPGARGGLVQLYDARVGGGFRERPSPLPCDGDQCQGAPATRPVVSAPAGGRGSDERPGVRPGVSVARLTVAQQRALARGRSVVVRVRVSRAGMVRAGLGARGTSASKRAVGAGTVRLAVRLSRAARRTLARTGRLRVTLTVHVAGVSEPRTQKLDLRSSR